MIIQLVLRKNISQNWFPLNGFKEIWELDLAAEKDTVLLLRNIHTVIVRTAVSVTSFYVSILKFALF